MRAVTRIPGCSTTGNNREPQLQQRLIVDGSRGFAQQEGTDMPLVEVTLTEGRSAEQIRALIHELTGAVERAVGAPAANIRVVVREIPVTHWAAGDVTIAERRNQARAADTGAPIDAERSTS
jgi:4-oxalocrotonate tautomerase